MKQLFLFTILSVSFVSVVGEDLQTESEASKPPKTAVDAESGPSKTKDGKERVPVQMSGPRRLIIDFIQLPDDNRGLCPTKECNENGACFGETSEPNCLCDKGFCGDRCKSSNCTADEMCHGNGWLMHPYNGNSTCICSFGYEKPNCELRKIVVVDGSTGNSSSSSAKSSANKE